MVFRPFNAAKLINTDIAVHLPVPVFEERAPVIADNRIPHSPPRLGGLARLPCGLSGIGHAHCEELRVVTRPHDILAGDNVDVFFHHRGRVSMGGTDDQLVDVKIRQARTKMLTGACPHFLGDIHDVTRHEDGLFQSIRTVPRFYGQRIGLQFALYLSGDARGHLPGERYRFIRSDAHACRACMKGGG